MSLEWNTRITLHLVLMLGFGQVCKSVEVYSNLISWEFRINYIWHFSINKIIFMFQALAYQFITKIHNIIFTLYKVFLSWFFYNGDTLILGVLWLNHIPSCYTILGHDYLKFTIFSKKSCGIFCLLLFSLTSINVVMLACIVFH